MAGRRSTKENISADEQRAVIERALAETGWSIEQLAAFWELEPATLEKYQSGQKAGKMLLRCIVLTPQLQAAGIGASALPPGGTSSMRDKFEDLLRHGDELEARLVREVVGSLWEMMGRRLVLLSKRPNRTSSKS